MTPKCSALALALLALAVPARAEEYRDAVDVRPGGTLVVELGGGSIEVETHDAPRVEAEISAPDWPKWHFELTSDGTNARLVGSRAFWPFGWARARVRVPREYSLDLYTAGGGIEIEKVRGAVKARTSGGSIELDGADGQVELKTSGGSIRVEDLHGDAKLRTSGGSISAEKVSGRVDAETSGGSIRLDEVGGEVRATTAGGGITARFVGAAAGELRTSGGGIDVEIPPGTGAELDARTSGGQVELDRDLAFTGERESRRLRGKLGPGGARLDVETSGGNIEVRAR